MYLEHEKELSVILRNYVMKGNDACLFLKPPTLIDFYDKKLDKSELGTTVCNSCDFESLY